MSDTYKVTIDGAEYEYPAGTPYAEIVRDVQPQYPYDVLLVNRDGKLRELHKTLDRDCNLSMVTAKQRPGYQSYERSAVFLLLKALEDTVGRENLNGATVEFSVSSALFLRASGNFTLDDALLKKVEARMRELVKAKLPIEKQNVYTDDAIDLFHSLHMEDKARLFRFRVSSRLHIYTLDGYTDYFYGYMVPDTGYLKVFALEAYEDGFLLRLPTMNG